MMSANNAILEKVSSQQASVAVLQSEVAFLRASAEETSQVLRGYNGYAGLVSDVQSLSKSVADILAALKTIQTSLEEIRDSDPCDTCGIEKVRDDVAAVRRIHEDYPNILWLLRYKPKQTIPWLIIAIVSIASLGHLQLDPLFTALLSAIGLSPTIIQSLQRLFGDAK